MKWFTLPMGHVPAHANCCPVLAADVNCCSAGVRFWHKADIPTRHPMSAFGVKRTLLGHCGMSAYDLKRTLTASDFHPTDP